MHLKPLVGPLFVFALISSAVAQDSGAVQRIAFGSCLWQDDPQAIWGAVLASQPDVFVFLGDNVYADTQDVNVMRQEYQKLAAKPGYQNLQKISQVAAIWDDHDYGENDAGRGYPMKEQSKRVFLDFFGEPENSARRTREGGIYTSYQYGPQGQRVQVILLDTRWARTPINTVSEAEAKEREEVGAGPYTATVGKNAWMLGEAQWRWLEAELRQPRRTPHHRHEHPLPARRHGLGDLDELPRRARPAYPAGRGDESWRRLVHHWGHALGAVLQTH
jgi:alkaline phosphatase D